MGFLWGEKSVCGFRAGRSAKIWGRCDPDRTPPAPTSEAEELGRKHGTSVSSHYDTLTRGRVRPPWRVLPLRAASGQYLLLTPLQLVACVKHYASQPSPFTQHGRIWTGFSLCPPLFLLMLSSPQLGYHWPTLQALVYHILPSTTALFSYAIGSRNCQLTSS